MICQNDGDFRPMPECMSPQYERRGCSREERTEERCGWPGCDKHDNGCEHEKAGRCLWFCDEKAECADTRETCRPEETPAPAQEERMACRCGCSHTEELPVLVKPEVQHCPEQTYEPWRALRHGTLFPALWKPMCGEHPTIVDCPADRGQIYAFALWELRLYLDTHPYDWEAWRMLHRLDRQADHPNYATTFMPGFCGCGEEDFVPQEYGKRCQREPWPWEEIACRAEPAGGGNGHVCV